MAIDILLIHHQLTFAVTLKQAVERAGRYAVHPFTTADAAFDYLLDHPQDVAVVDFGLVGIDGAAVVERLHEIQPELPIIVTPTPPFEDIAEMEVQGMLDEQFTARELITLINDIIQPEDDEAPSTQQPQVPSLRTRILKNVSNDPGATRDIGPRPPDPATEQFPGRVTNPLSTGSLENDDAAVGFTSLDNVLNSMSDEELAGLYDPAFDGEQEDNEDSFVDDLGVDPPGPLADTGMLDEVLRSLGPETEGQKGSRSSSFTDLVNSMKSDEPRKPLHERTQPFVEFILTGGMDNLLSEIERVKTETGQLKAQDPEADPTFERLSQEEPPLPTFEESGTVSDLLSGISDPGFRTVMALLRDDAEGRESVVESMTDDELKEALASIYESRRVAQETTSAEFDFGDEEAAADARRATSTGEFDFIFDFSDDEEDEDEITPARMILETALDESAPLDSFSLEALIKSIDRQLPAHRPNVQPLPSWSQDTGQIVAEPDFLQDQFSESIDISNQTTRPVQSQQVEPPSDTMETDVLDSFWDEFGAAAERQESLRVAQEPPADVADSGDILDAYPDDEFAVEAEAVESSETPFDWDDLTFEDGEIAIEGVETWADAEAESVVSATEESAWPDLDLPPQIDESEEFRPRLFDPDFGHLAAVYEAVDLPGYKTAGTDDTEPVTTYEDEATVARESVSELTPSSEGTTEPEAAPVVEAGAGAMMHSEDPFIAQLALSLTQVSLELTAEATLLARKGEIVAYAGQLLREDIEELRDAIANDWEAETDQARIRFITLPGSNKEYMLYSRRTEEGFTLSMIFAGATPLRDIRRQGKRLAQALRAVPETGGQPTLEASGDMPETSLEPSESVSQSGYNIPLPPARAVPTTPYACVWLTRNPDDQLSEIVAQAIMTGLRTQLQEQAWKIRTIEAQEGYVYLLAEIPGELPPPEIIRDLKQRSGEIAQKQDPALNIADLWADGYLMVTPGRALDHDEIQQFITFERMD